MLREHLRLRSAAQLATKLGCDAKTVRRWRLGEAMPLPIWRERLCDVIGIPGEAWELELTIDDDRDALTEPRVVVSVRPRLLPTDRAR